MEREENGKEGIGREGNDRVEEEGKGKRMEEKEREEGKGKKEMKGRNEK